MEKRLEVFDFATTTFYRSFNWPYDATCAFVAGILHRRRSYSASENSDRLTMHLGLGSISVCTSRTPTSLVVGKACVPSIITTSASGGS